MNWKVMINYSSKGIEVNGEFISLEDIVWNCNRQKVKELDLVIVNICWDRRSGSIYENRVLPKVLAEEYRDFMVGHEVYFGEIEGKHSEVYGEVEADDVTIGDNTVFITEFLRKNSEGREMNHSFLSARLEGIECLGGEELTDEELDSVESFARKIREFTLN